MLVLILRSADAEGAPRIRTCGRASRRMRTGDCSPPCFETHRSAFGLWKRLRSRRAAMLLSMRARGARRILAKRSKRAFCPSMSSPRKRGPMITAGGYGSRLSARLRGRRPGRRSLGPCEAPTCGCAKSGPTEFHCFRPVINNDFCNSNVLGHRSLCVTPYVIPDVSPSVVIPVVTTMCHHPSS
jgi:hypothetical protein